MAKLPFGCRLLALITLLACSDGKDAAGVPTTGGSDNTAGQNGSGTPGGDGTAPDASSDAAPGPAPGSDAGDPGQGNGAPDASSPADASIEGPVSCDPRELRCKIAETPCPAGEVHQIVDACYGPCVRITACRCDKPEGCPHEETYTCWNNTQRCNFYGP